MPWWRQTAAEKQLRVTLEDILVAVRDWRQWESDRLRKVDEGVEGEGM